MNPTPQDKIGQQVGSRDVCHVLNSVFNNIQHIPLLTRDLVIVNLMASTWDSVVAPLPFRWGAVGEFYDRG